jgi:hypothetical protein
MVSSCLPCFTRSRFRYIRPRRINRHHPKHLYDVRNLDALPLPTPIFVPPSPPPPEPDLPLAFIPPPTHEGPLEPFPRSHHRPRSIPSPPLPVQVQLLTYPVFVPYPEPVIYREPVHYPEPIHNHALPVHQDITLNDIPQ